MGYETRLLDEILSDANMAKAVAAVKSNKGAAGIDKMTVNELDKYFSTHLEEIKEQIRTKTYKPQPVRRVYIPKANGKLRPLGIPIVVDRVIQQATAQVLMKDYEPHFSEYSYGFRPGRDCHKAVQRMLDCLNEGYEWVVDLDIEKYFDTVHHDRLISIIRERINESEVLHLIRSFLKAGVMEEGMFSETKEGVPQGGPLSPILSNIYLDKLDKELETRGLRFARYADDCVILVRTDTAANRVMNSISSWLKRKLFLNVSPTKTKVVRPNESAFLGFGFTKREGEWNPRPLESKKESLKEKTKEILRRKVAQARPLGVTFQKLNSLMRGWINYFGIGLLKSFLEEYGGWMRHKVRVVILKQWKNRRTMKRNLQSLNRARRTGFSEDQIMTTVYSRKGVYARASFKILNLLLSPEILGTPNPKAKRPGLINPLEYFQENFCKQN